MAAAAYLLAHPEIEHGPVKVAFNPDEEVGRGVTHFPVDTFGAVAAYTVDGSTAGEIQQETFSGAQVRMRVRGRAIHPGWAKGELVNAIKLAAQIVARLPEDRLSPETTADREGYVHPMVISGDSSEVELRFIVRDFENDLLDRHVEFLHELATEVAATDERCSIEVESRIQYRNMRDTLEQHPEIVANLEEAVRRAGLEPALTAIRGGTDGSALTEMGLPTPNIFTGGHDAHSEREWVCVEDMGLAARWSSSWRRSGPSAAAKPRGILLAVSADPSRPPVPAGKPGPAKPKPRFRFGWWAAWIVGLLVLNYWAGIARDAGAIPRADPVQPVLPDAGAGAATSARSARRERRSRGRSGTPRATRARRRRRRSRRRSRRSPTRTRSRSCSSASRS